MPSSAESPGSPYRLAGTSGNGPAELSLTARVPDALWLAATRVGALRLLMGVPVAIAIAVLGTATHVFVFVTLGGLAYAVWLRGQVAKSVARTVLRVVDGDLIVARSDRQDALRSRFDDVLGIRVDSETQQAFAIRGHGVRAATLGKGVGRARVVLDLANERDPIMLSEALLSHTDCVEWVPKLYRFFRAHGWVPADEHRGTEVPASV